MRFPNPTVTGAILGITLAFSAQALQTFQSKPQAQQHCPSDVVVWLNMPTMIWHLRGQRWYGMTKNGAYVFRQEAAAEGARGSRNGQ